MVKLTSIFTSFFLLWYKNPVNCCSKSQLLTRPTKVWDTFHGLPFASRAVMERMRGRGWCACISWRQHVPLGGREQFSPGCGVNYKLLWSIFSVLKSNVLSIWHLLMWITHGFLRKLKPIVETGDIQSK